MLVTTVHSEQDPDISHQTFCFFMSSPRLPDLERLIQPSTEVKRSEPPDCLGGLDDLLDRAMDFSTETEGKAGGLKTGEFDTGNNDPEDLLDFDDFLVSSKSRVKLESTVVKTERIPMETAIEIDES